MFLLVQDVETKIDPLKKMVVYAVMEPRRETQSRIPTIMGFIPHLIRTDTTFASNTKVSFF